MYIQITAYIFVIFHFLFLPYCYGMNKISLQLTMDYSTETSENNIFFVWIWFYLTANHSLCYHIKLFFFFPIRFTYRNFLQRYYMILSQKKYLSKMEPNNNHLHDTNSSLDVIMENLSQQRLDIQKKSKKSATPRKVLRRRTGKNFFVIVYPTLCP